MAAQKVYTRNVSLRLREQEAEQLAAVAKWLQCSSGAVVRRLLKEPLEAAARAVGVSGDRQ